ncbi:retrovirus-related pol polyprotein from transposon TNT 1-94 [Tanacetum coccineum]|uniref:Retrovirus-related pol polyprotein from transposon TNT 1-94 n=1 Tax=Tanacetum coccineum TaxID=301880 RepID=A0ABQ5FV63_9ASTR
MFVRAVRAGAIYRIEVCTEACAGAIYPNKVVSEPGYLYQKKLHEPLAVAKPTCMKDEDWTLLDRQALGVVRLSLAKNVAYNVVNEKTTYSLFKALSNMYEKLNHVNEFNSILSRLMSVDIKFDDEVQALLLLSSLPESWSGTVTAVSGSTGSTKLKFDNIRDLILGEDLRRKTSGEYSNSLLSAEDKGMGRKQDRGQKHNRSRSKSKKRGQSKNMQDITCWNCNQKGYFQNPFSNPVTSRDKGVNMAARGYDDALVCCVENTIDDRIMDSSASFHATYCKEELERFKLCSGKVCLADDKTLDIAGVGDVVLKTSFGTSWTLKDVRYIPGVKKRLISVGQLDEEGYHVGFGDQQWKVTKGSLVVAHGNKRGSLYLVEVPSNGINAAIDGRGNATLWHQRLGHMSEKGMNILASKGRIPDLQKAVVGFCEPCVLGKQKKVSFVKSGNTRKLQRLELVHTNVYDPTSVASIGGSRYYVTFINDSSRKVWVYFLKNKSEVFNTFMKWKAAVENETNLWVKCLKSDNGGEYSSRDFIEYYAENGFRMLKTVPETPQQNGVAERMNRTLNERAKKEEWQGKEVSLAHLRVFGCDSYVKVKDVARDKLDAKSVKCTFIGYGSDEMGYRFWDSKSHKVVRIRDVTFNEDSLYGAKAATYSKPRWELRYSGSFEDSGRSDEEDSEDRASSEEGGSETPQLRRSTRESRAPVRYSPSANYLLLTENGEPESYSEALSSKEFVQWKKAINEEMVSLEKNQTWSLVRLPAGKKALQSKWVFRVKEEQDGKKKYKARLVVKGFQQKQGVDYNEIFSPVVKMTTIRLVLSIVAAENLHLEQLDVKTAFLHGDLDEDIYMTQPEGFQSAGKEENLVCKLKKSLYGLKQAPRQWYLKFDSFMQRAGYKRCAMDHCCYLKKVGSSSIILLLYVDDMLVAGSDMAEIKKLKRQLSKEFEMKDLGPAKQILGMSIIRDKTKGTLRLSQEKYIGKVLEKFNMKDAEARCQPLGDHLKLSKKQSPKTEASRRRMAKVPYASAVGSVMYTMVCTRPDIAHAVGVVSRFMSNPGREHWEAVKWLLLYLKGTSKTTLCFSRKEVVLEGFSDSDYGEAEYMAIEEAGKELVWLKNFLEELDRAQTECVLFCDNQSAIHLTKNPVFHGRTKHIKIRYHYIRELVSEGTLSLKKILRAKNPADMLTKVVTTEK